MPWLNLQSGNERKLGKGLALLHLESSKWKQENFGWGKDGFIGFNPQIAGWEKSWGTCFFKLRLSPQIQMATRWGLRFPIKKFSSRLIKYLDIHNPQPSLVHGDLWKGNAAVNEKGVGVIFDPGYIDCFLTGDPVFFLAAITFPLIFKILVVFLALDVGVYYATT